MLIFTIAVFLRIVKQYGLFYAKINHRYLVFSQEFVTHSMSCKLYTNLLADLCVVPSMDAAITVISEFSCHPLTDEGCLEMWKLVSLKTVWSWF